MANSLYPAFPGLVLQPLGTTDVTVEGLATIHVSYVGPLDQVMALNVTTGMRHPYYVYVGVDSFRILNRRGDNVGQLELTYKGVFSFAQPRWTLQRSMTMIPVQQASDWAVEATAENGAINADGSDYDGSMPFGGWKADSKYAGIVSLPAPVFVVSKTTITVTPDTSGTIGAAESPGSPFSVGQLYFMAGASVQQGGVVWRNVKSWQTRPTVKLSDFANPAHSGGDSGGGS